MTMIFQAKGINPDDGRSVDLEIGWDHRTGYFYGVDRRVKSQYAVELRELVSGAGIWSPDELWERTSPFIHWNTRLYRAMRDVPAADRIRRLGSADRVNGMLISFDNNLRKYAQT